LHFLSYILFQNWRTRKEGSPEAGRRLNKNSLNPPGKVCQSWGPSLKFKWKSVPIQIQSHLGSVSKSSRTA
jgi:hypothetical protein